jgi:hypothetical protein
MLEWLVLSTATVVMLSEQLIKDMLWGTFFVFL